MEPWVIWVLCATFGVPLVCFFPIHPGAGAVAQGLSASAVCPFQLCADGYQFELCQPLRMPFGGWLGHEM